MTAQTELELCRGDNPSATTPDSTTKVEKVSDPKGDRMVVHRNGNFLPNRSL